jgi:CDP-glycerol glycerophosphotransferase (TagB/SpsB family)
VKAHDASAATAMRSDEVVVLPSDADATAYLGLCDVLVTDYSSIAFDYLLLGRPIVLLVPDLADYDDERGFLLPPAEFMPGQTCRTVDELCNLLEHPSGLRVDAEQYERLRMFFWGDSARPGATARVAAFVEQLAQPAAGAAS